VLYGIGELGAVRCGSLGYYGDAAYDTLAQSVLSITRLTAASAESRLLAGGDITLNGSAVLAAGHDLTSQGAQLIAGDQLALSADRGQGRDHRCGGGDA
jgi:hypothetical protein